MKPVMRKDFDKWYLTVQHREFNLHEEMVAYCQSDVQVLKAGCEIFQREWKNVSQWKNASPSPWPACGITQKIFALPYPGLGTSLRLEWETRTPTSESFPVVGMGKYPTDRGGHCTRVQRGRTYPLSRSASVSSGRVQPHDPDRVRVSRVFIERLSRVFPWQPGQDHPSPPRSHQTGIVRCHLAKTPAIANPRLPRDRLLEILVGPIASTTRSRRLCQLASVPRALAQPT